MKKRFSESNRNGQNTGTNYKLQIKLLNTSNLAKGWLRDNVTIVTDIFLQMLTSIWYGKNNAGKIWLNISKKWEWVFSGFLDEK